MPLLLLRARAHIALRRDLDAQADLRDIIRLDPQCGIAYRLLGELAARRDENESAAIFFREALRLDPDDREATDWLAIVGSPSRPAAAANKLPAPAAAAGRFLARAPQPTLAARSRVARAKHRPRSQPRREPRAKQPRPSHGSDDGRAPSCADAVADLASRGAAAGRYARRSWLASQRVAARAPRADDARSPLPRGSSLAPPVAPRTLTGRPPTRPMTRSPMPELPGFGEYLVETGILTRERLRAAQAYQRSMKVQLSTAIVTLGLATPQRIEWAAVAHQSQLAHR